MAVYQLNTALFAAGSGYLLYRQHRRSTSQREEGEDGLLSEMELQTTAAAAAAAATAATSPPWSSEAIRRFHVDYFSVYALAVAADWLQGPYIYATYKYQKNIPERVVGALYATGFIAAAASATVAGTLADRYGRRLACLFYCAIYTAACLAMLSDNLCVLFLGRICGGVGTTLLFSAFPAWLITEYHDRGLQNSTLRLNHVFSNITTLSCLVAICSGILGDLLVGSLGSWVWPFLVAAGCSCGAGCLILATWKENYGTHPSTKTHPSSVQAALATISDFPRLLALGLVSCVFEGTMYLVVFFWSAALTSARRHAGSDEELPFGIIFTNFMFAMMAGSVTFALSSHSRENVSFMLKGALLTVSCCLSVATLKMHEVGIFWAVCLIEFSIGIYFPCMELLKSEVVGDGVRGTAYSLMRVPLNVFVVVAHALDQEGDEHRDRVFLVCAGFLVLAFVALDQYSIA